MPLDDDTSRQLPAGELLTAVERLTVADTVEKVMEIVRDSARNLIGSDGVALILREGDLCFYAEEDAIGPLWKGQKFPMAACISGWAMLKRQSVCITDITKDPRIPFDLYAGTFVRSLVIIPIGTEPPVGALGAYWARAYSATEDELEVARTLARAAAFSIEHLRLIGALSETLSQQRKS